jgi:hypothetical protein
MAFDSLGYYTTPHKPWDHVGNMIPVVEHSEGTRPHGEFKPAAWLPVQYFDKHFEEYFVIMPGKILATDNDGRIVPAQYGLSGATVTYTTQDVEAGVINVTTGNVVATSELTSGTVTYNVSDIDGSPGFLGASGVAMAISSPIGVAPYAYWQWAGDGSAFDDGFNPAGFRRHNHNLQHQVAILCDYVLELPLVPATTASANLTYASYSSNLVTFAAVANLPVAMNTVRTPISFADGTESNASTTFVVQVDAATDVTQLGDWHIDLTTGVVTCWAAADPGAGNLYAITYYHYASAPSSVSKFASAVGDLKAGDFVKCDANSNYTVATPKVYGVAAGDNFDTFSHIMGQVIEVENVYDKDALGRVRTAYNPAIGTDASGSLPGYAGQMDQMPGSATGVVSDKVHYAGAANLVVRINLISR